MHMDDGEYERGTGRMSVAYAQTAGALELEPDYKDLEFVWEYDYRDEDLKLYDTDGNIIVNYDSQTHEK